MSVENREQSISLHAADPYFLYIKLLRSSHSAWLWVSDIHTRDTISYYFTTNYKERSNRSVKPQVRPDCSRWSWCASKTKVVDPVFYTSIRTLSTWTVRQWLVVKRRRSKDRPKEFLAFSTKVSFWWLLNRRDACWRIIMFRGPPKLGRERLDKWRIPPGIPPGINNTARNTARHIRHETAHPICQRSLHFNILPWTMSDDNQPADQGTKSDYPPSKC